MMEHDYYMRTHVNLCRVISMWPLPRDEERLSRIAYHKTVVFSITLFCFLLFLPLTLKIIVGFDDMDGIATVIDFATVFASGIFRYVYIYIRSEKYLSLVETMENNFIFESYYPVGKNKMTMEKYRKIGTYLGLVYFGASLFWVLQMCFGPIVVHTFKGEDIANMTDAQEVPLVFQAYYPFNLRKQPNHSFVYIFQVLGFLALAYVYLISDAFWYMVIILTIGQLDLIHHSLTNIQLEEGKEKEMQQGLRKCVKQHQVIRSFMRDVENLLAPIVLVDFMHAVLSITFLLLDFTIAAAESNWMKAFHLFEYFTVSLVHMFLLDYLGNELSLKDERLSVAIYDTPWYIHPRQVSSHLLMVTRQAQHPFRLTGGKMYNMSLEFFVATIKTIFSYFMVLRQLRDEREIKG